MKFGKLDAIKLGMLSRREMLVQLRKLGVDTPSQCKGDCLSFEHYMLVKYGYKIPKSEGNPPEGGEIQELLLDDKGMGRVRKDIPLPWKKATLMQENPLDGHIHLHSHEIIPGRWERPPSRRAGGVSWGLFCGALLSISLIGLLWTQLWGRH